MPAWVMMRSSPPAHSDALVYQRPGRVKVEPEPVATVSTSATLALYDVWSVLQSTNRT